MKKLLTFILAFIMVVSMASCKKEEPNNDPETTPEEFTTAPEAAKTIFAADGKSEYSIVYTASTLTTGGENIIFALRMALRRQFANSDFTLDKFGSSEAKDKDAKEILIGETGRELSKDLMAVVPDGCFGIEVTENKIAIYAGTERLTQYAVDYFRSNYIPDNGSTDVKLEIGRYVSDVIKLDIKSLISDEPGFTSQGTLVYNIAATGDQRLMQGGCTDGKYMYYCLTNGGTGTRCAYVYKYDIATSKLVKKSELLDTDHSNDMTYNSKTNELIISNFSPRKDTLTIVDPDTLEVKRTETIPFSIFCIEYNAENDAYVVGLAGSKDFTILTADFQIDRRFVPEGSERFVVENTGYTAQGVTCDDEYVYFVQYNLNVIMVYDWSGKFINKIHLDIFGTEEPENLSIIDDMFYIGCNNADRTGGILYTVKIIPPTK